MQSSPQTDRTFGIFVWAHDDYSDQRARSQAFDAARQRKVRRDRSREPSEADFEVGDVVVVQRSASYRSGRLVYALGQIVDKHALGTRWGNGGLTIRVLHATDPAYVDHLFPLYVRRDWGAGRFMLSVLTHEEYHARYLGVA